jgi:hypothetical protein
MLLAELEANLVHSDRKDNKLHKIGGQVGQMLNVSRESRTNLVKFNSPVVASIRNLHMYMGSAP